MTIETLRLMAAIGRQIGADKDPLPDVMAATASIKAGWEDPDQNHFRNVRDRGRFLAMALADRIKQAQKLCDQSRALRAFKPLPPE